MIKFYKVLIFLLSCFFLLFGDADSLSEKNYFHQHPNDSFTSQKESPFDKFKAGRYNLFIFYQKGNERGYSFSEEEINTLHTAFSRAFPNAPIDTNYIKDQLVIEKYIEETGIFTIDDEQIKNAYQDYLTLYPQENPPSLESLKPFLYCKALASNEDILELSIKVNKAHLRHIQKLKLESMKPWPLDQIRLKASGNQCLAYFNENDSCLVTVREFNHALSFLRMRKQTELDSARIIVLRELIVDKFLSEQARKNGIADNESIKEEIRKHNERMSWREKTMKMGRPIRDRTLLWETYKTYYKQLFCGYEKITLDILGSTDSLRINSLYQKVTQTKGNKKLKDVNETTNDSLPWLQYDSENLPEILVIPTDTLLQDDITRPFRTPFGFFICRIAKIDKIKEISFAEARQQCIFLVTKEAYLRNMDSLIEAQAWQYYQNHSLNYTTPDTLILYAWLFPFKKANSNGNQKNESISYNYLNDTTLDKGITMSSLSLPKDVRIRVETLYKKRNNKPGIIGPINGKLGVWCFRVIQVKAGGIPIPFAEVKDGIIDTLMGRSFSQDNTVSDEVKKLKFQKGLAKIYVRHTVNEVERLSKEDIQKLIDNGVIDISGLKKNSTEEYKYDRAREIYQDMIYDTRRKKIQEWVSAVRVDKQILFRTDN